MASHRAGTENWQPGFVLLKGYRMQLQGIMLRNAMPWRCNTCICYGKADMLHKKGSGSETNHNPV